MSRRDERFEMAMGFILLAVLALLVVFRYEVHEWARPFLPG